MPLLSLLFCNTSLFPSFLSQVEAFVLISFHSLGTDFLFLNSLQKYFFQPILELLCSNKLEQRGGGYFISFGKCPIVL